MASSAAEILRETPVFRELSDEDRHLFAHIGQTKLYPKGELIFAEGERAEHLYTVARGKVKVFKVTPSGKEIILAILGPGTPVGAVAVYEAVPFPASAMAFEDSVLIRIPSRAYFDLLEKHPDLVRRLLGAMTQRLMEFNASQSSPAEPSSRASPVCSCGSPRISAVVNREAFSYPSISRARSSPISPARRSRPASAS